MIKILLSTAFSRDTNGWRELEVEGTTVKEAMIALSDQFPALEQKIWHQQRVSVNNYISVCVGDKDIRSMNGIDTAVKDGDEISIILSIIGG
jgi:molybdopterin converting factor small subunit